MEENRTPALSLTKSTLRRSLHSQLSPQRFALASLDLRFLETLRQQASARQVSDSRPSPPHLWLCSPYLLAIRCPLLSAVFSASLYSSSAPLRRLPAVFSVLPLEYSGGLKYSGFMFCGGLFAAGAPPNPPPPLGRFSSPSCRLFSKLRLICSVLFKPPVSFLMATRSGTFALYSLISFRDSHHSFHWLLSFSKHQTLSVFAPSPKGDIYFLRGCSFCMPSV